MRRSPLPSIEWPDRSETECLHHLRAGGIVLVRSSATKWWGAVALMLFGAVICGLAFVGALDGVLEPGQETSAVLGLIVVAIVFGLCTLLCLLAVVFGAAKRIRNAEVLVLTRSGLGSAPLRDLHAARGARGRGTPGSLASGSATNEIPWSEILRFEIVILPSKQPDALAPKRLIYTLTPAGMARIETRIGRSLRPSRPSPLRRMAPNSWWADPAVMVVGEPYRGRLSGLLSLLSAARTAHGGPA